MPPVTRTIGQLHFEDLEPHRFEDLVRALIYEFRVWQKLEATGRGGADDGFDVRGWEADTSISQSEDAAEEEATTAEPTPSESKLWLVQCKREKSIGPKPLLEYLSAIPTQELSRLYGLIFAAACDFSKKAHDTFNDWCREHGLSECYLWGRGELEDLLVQPKNDHLLFAYFGISLVVRRRSLRTELRSRLATKRKAIKLFGKGEYANGDPAMFRDPEDDRYPYSHDVDGQPFKQPIKWLVRRVVGVDHKGLVVLYRDRMAYVADDGKSWDALSASDRAVPDQFQNPWEHMASSSAERVERARAKSFWEAIPEQNRARLQVFGLVPFDDILAIDEDGDGYENTELVHIFVSFGADNHPFRTGFNWIEVGPSAYKIAADPAHRLKYFPEVLPEVPDPPIGE